MVNRPCPSRRRPKHLCPDAAYHGEATTDTLLAHGYIPHFKGCKQEAGERIRQPGKGLGAG